jgi:large subunit ribosomal protein L23
MNGSLILKPRLSEQTYALAQAQQVYIFDVPKAANKHEVARAVAAQFNVEVASVNMTNIKGKAKSTISLTGRRRRASGGVRSDAKKAYVHLAKGASLPIFAAIEEEEEKEQTAQEQADKAIAKQLKQGAKKPVNAPKTPGRALRIFKKQGDK